MSVKYEASMNFGGLADFQNTIDSMSSAVKAANDELQKAKEGMKAGSPETIMAVQLQAQTFAQVMTTMTNLLKSLNDVTSTVNRNIN
jgi:hypothetical protein